MKTFIFKWRDTPSAPTNAFYGRASENPRQEQSNLANRKRLPWGIIDVKFHIHKQPELLYILGNYQTLEWTVKTLLIMTYAGWWWHSKLWASWEPCTQSRAYWLWGERWVMPVTIPITTSSMQLLYLLVWVNSGAPFSLLPILVEKPLKLHHTAAFIRDKRRRAQHSTVNTNAETPEVWCWNTCAHTASPQVLDRRLRLDTCRQRNFSEWKVAYWQPDKCWAENA